MHITLRAGEKLYLNGAVLRADRKVSIELMNDATFLLEAHVMRVENATSPLRQLYFVVQMMLMNPQDAGDALRLFEESAARMDAAYDDPAARRALARTRQLVAGRRLFDALKVLREAFARDDALMAGADLALAS